MGQEITAREIVVDGIRTRVEESGQGPVLLLVHGLGGPLMWQRITATLSAAFRVINLHLPGFGESDPPPRPFAAGDYAKFLLKALDMLSIESATVAGTSYGGEIASRLAILAGGGRVERLILVNSTGFGQYRGAAALAMRSRLFIRLLAWSLGSRRLVCLLGSLSFHDRSSRPPDLCDNFFDQLSRPGHREAWINGMREVFTGSGSTARLLGRTPALLVWGEFDRMVRHRDPCSTGAPLATTIVIPGAGHSLPLEKPDELCSAIRDFARNVG
jgi:pimeloyl-ACP methyl ester carboxylesterase